MFLIIYFKRRSNDGKKHSRKETKNTFILWSKINISNPTRVRKLFNRKLTGGNLTHHKIYSSHNLLYCFFCCAIWRLYFIYTQVLYLVRTLHNLRIASLILHHLNLLSPSFLRINYNLTWLWSDSFHLFILRIIKYLHSWRNEYIYVNNTATRAN